MENDKQHVYVDTQYVYAYAVGSKKDEDRYVAEQFKSLISNKNPNILPKIPFTVIGETINNIKTKNLSSNEEQNIMDKILKLSRNNSVDFIPASPFCLKIASYIKSQDPRLEDTDVLIVSHAIADPNSSLLLFIEDAIINSGVIDELRVDRANKIKEICDHNSNLRYRDLNIRDFFKEDIN
ncbi:MAG: hypothetical protein PQ975_11155 [Methanobacterium sp.]|jgi:predicted nucleic acid-binding protein